MEDDTSSPFHRREGNGPLTKPGTCTFTSSKNSCEYAVILNDDAPLLSCQIVI